MPLFEYLCTADHRDERYFPLAAQAPAVTGCRQCGAVATRQLARAIPLQYFSEARGQVIQNLDPGRVLHSHGEHQQLMKQRGVEPATDWGVSMKQTDGLKTRAQPDHPAQHIVA